MSTSGVNLEKYLIPLNEINRATDSFSRERYIGSGGFGDVYRGQLSEQWQSRTVAIKRRDAESRQGWREFHNEIELLSKFHHENILAFIGYCDEGDEMILVYEYASNGSLDDHLRDPKKMSCISWVRRLKICIGAARGLQYLHSGLGEQEKVIHRDVKSANILLDGNMVAKICDFGLSKLGTTTQSDTQLYTMVAGTQFYMDPTYHESSILRKESDVYSFGVVLFEIFSGTLVYGGIHLMNVVRRYQNKPDKVVDPCIRDQINSRSFETFKEIAYRCINLTLTQRPALDTVVQELEAALNQQIPIPADSSMMESIIHELDSVSPDDKQLGFMISEIRLFTEYCLENDVVFAKNGVIPLLAHLLTKSDSWDLKYTFTALYYLSINKEHRGIIISSEADLGFVNMLEKGSNIARENAAVAFYHLCWFRYELTSDYARVIPPLVLLLREGTTAAKKNATKSLNRLCYDNDHNTELAVRAGVVPILVELLTDPQGVLKEESIDLLDVLRWMRDALLAIGEANGVPHLVEVIGTESQSHEEKVVALLVKLCSMDEKYLVEAQEHGVMEKLKGVRQHGTHVGKSKARYLRRMIKDHQHVNYGSDNELFVSYSTDSWLVAICTRGAFLIFLIFDKVTRCSCIR